MKVYDKREKRRKKKNTVVVSRNMFVLSLLCFASCRPSSEIWRVSDRCHACIYNIQW